MPVENENSTFVRIVVHLDYDHRGERDRTNPIIFELHGHLQALTEKYEGLSLAVLGYADCEEPSEPCAASWSHPSSQCAEVNWKEAWIEEATTM